MASGRALRNPLAMPPGGYAAMVVAFAKRLRATRAAAAAPNSSTIGGAGTGAGVPPDDPVPPLLDIPLLPYPPFELQPPLLL